eukprot:TRINITY_DN6058_c0_g6_i1.p1 TRINITY_DN6058_c0_g6~~TRINITY_DN6058_c0_g6_i1.p1  ORF type:complete len:131 (-),score=29.22 TRINITY_DN6058_c0_g6_i1:367-759(-)
MNVVSIHKGYTNTVEEFGGVIRVLGEIESEDLVFNSRGELIVSTVHEISILYKLVKPFGSFSKQNGQFNYPISLCVDALDNILVCDYENKSVQAFDREGNWIAAFGNQKQSEGDPFHNLLALLLMRMVTF